MTRGPFGGFFGEPMCFCFSVCFFFSVWDFFFRLGFICVLFSLFGILCFFFSVWDFFFRLGFFFFSVWDFFFPFGFLWGRIFVCLFFWGSKVSVFFPVGFFGERCCFVFKEFYKYFVKGVWAMLGCLLLGSFVEEKVF